MALSVCVRKSVCDVHDILSKVSSCAGRQACSAYQASGLTGLDCSLNVP